MSYPEWQKNIREAQQRVNAESAQKAEERIKIEDEKEAKASEAVADFLELLGMPRGERDLAGRKIDVYYFNVKFVQGSREFYVVREGDYDFQARHRNHWGNILEDRGGYRPFPGSEDEFGAWIANTIDELEEIAKSYENKPDSAPIVTLTAIPPSDEEAFYQTFRNMIYKIVRELSEEAGY